MVWWGHLRVFGLLAAKEHPSSFGQSNTKTPIHCELKTDNVQYA